MVRTADVTSYFVVSTISAVIFKYFLLAEPVAGTHRTLRTAAISAVIFRYFLLAEPATGTYGTLRFCGTALENHCVVYGSCRTYGEQQQNRTIADKSDVVEVVYY